MLPCVDLRKMNFIGRDSDILCRTLKLNWQNPAINKFKEKQYLMPIPEG
jgi:hypothetical protein